MSRRSAALRKDPNLNPYPYGSGDAVRGRVDHHLVFLRLRRVALQLQGACLSVLFLSEVLLPGGGQLEIRRVVVQGQLDRLQLVVVPLSVKRAKPEPSSLNNLSC